MTVGGGSEPLLLCTERAQLEAAPGSPLPLRENKAALGAVTGSQCFHDQFEFVHLSPI
jgi:hypothetical protein